MKKRYVATFMILVILVMIMHTGVLAQEKSGSYYLELEEYVETYNSNLGSIPGIVKRLFANENINFYISFDQGEEVIGVATSGSCEILTFQAEELGNPTLLAYIDGAMIDAALAEGTQEKALEAVNSIKLEGVGFMKKMKVAFLNLMLKVVSWFI